MIECDRALLRRMADVNTTMSEIVLRLLAHQDCGELNGRDLQSVGTAFIQLGADMCVRAAQLLRPAIAAPTAVADTVVSGIKAER